MCKEHQHHFIQNVPSQKQCQPSSWCSKVSMHLCVSSPSPTLAKNAEQPKRNPKPLGPCSCKDPNKNQRHVMEPWLQNSTSVVIQSLPSQSTRTNSLILCCLQSTHRNEPPKRTMHIECVPRVHNKKQHNTGHITIAITLHIPPPAHSYCTLLCSTVTADHAPTLSDN